VLAHAEHDTVHDVGRHAADAVVVGQIEEDAPARSVLLKLSLAHVFNRLVLHTRCCFRALSPRQCMLSVQLVRVEGQRARCETPVIVR
jgi:hypothetical protein